MVFGVVFDDERLLVVDKPAGLPVHPTARYAEHTFTALAKAAFPARKVDPAHRLDRETSGLMACGCAPKFTRALKASFAAGRVTKAYLALVQGDPGRDRFSVEAPLSLTGASGVKVRMHVTEGGLPSHTDFEVLGRRRAADGAPVALVACHPRTGRQHQIRAHLHHAGLHLVGDKIYGPDEMIFDRFTKRELSEADHAVLRLPAAGPARLAPVAAPPRDGRAGRPGGAARARPAGLLGRVRDGVGARRMGANGLFPMPRAALREKEAGHGLLPSARRPRDPGPTRRCAPSIAPPDQQRHDPDRSPRPDRPPHRRGRHRIGLSLLLHAAGPPSRRGRPDRARRRDPGRRGRPAGDRKEAPGPFPAPRGERGHGDGDGRHRHGGLGCAGAGPRAAAGEVAGRRHHGEPRPTTAAAWG